MARTTTQPAFHYAASDAMAYNVSRWERLLYDARLGTSAALAERVGNVAEAIRQHHRPTMRRLEQVEEREAAQRAVGADAATFGAEMFARLYNDPAQADGAQGWAPSAHAVADELPEWQGLRAAVKGDPDFSALATSEVLNAVAGRLPGLLQAVQDEEAQQAQGQGQGQPGDGQGEGQGQARSQELGKAGQALRAALRAACERAQQQVTEAREAMEGIAPGSAYAPPTHEQKDPRRLELAEQLLRQPQLRDVLRKAGKLVRLAERAEATRDPHARSVVVGVEQGADIPRVMPAALAGLGHPVLRLLVYKGIADRTLPQYRLEGKVPQGKGPLVVLVDESSSMKGEGEQWAHAATLACIQLGAKENREVAVVMFNHGVSTAWVAQVDGTVATLPTTSPKDATPKPWGKRVDLALELCTRKSRGGTDFGAPLAWGMDYLEARNPRADLIFITDGQATASPATMDRLGNARTAGLRVFGLTVNGGSVAGNVAAICTEVVDIDRAEQADKAIARALPVRR